MLVFFYLAYAEQERIEWMIVLVVSGLLEIFFKVALGRDIWNIVDVAWAVLLIFSIFRKEQVKTYEQQ